MGNISRNDGIKLQDMTVEEETDFLMACNEMEQMPNIYDVLVEFRELGIPMYVLSI